jgi:3',5'-cyclic AMP phosphodiesterase CpdA
MINLKSIVFVLFSFSLFSQSEGSNRNIEKHHTHHHHYKNLHHWEIPSQDPDRIILTFNGDPSTKRAVTWRTDSSVLSAKAQIALAGPNKNFVTDASSYHAITEVFDLGAYKSNNSFDVHYHSVIFEDLTPNSLYTYRVGDGEIWSEWIQFRTASKGYAPTEFVYFGDAQNDILSHWSRVIRMAYQTAPNSSFVIHAGDLVDDAHLDYEWAQWFKAGGFIHKQWTAIPVVGNHEFKKTSFSSPRKLSIQWRPQFNLPVEKNLDQSLHETVYSVNYQGILILVLNSNEFLEKQTEYIKETLRNSDAKWKIVTCHHSIFSPAKGRDFEYARKNWKPLFDLYGVDLVLNGHDHSYARGHVPIKSTVKGVSGNINTLYITSVSGPKQYEIDSIKMKNYKADGYKSDKVGEQIQFFQVIKVDDQTLTYTAYTATGNEYDKAIITKNFKTGFKTYQ